MRLLDRLVPLLVQDRIAMLPNKDSAAVTIVLSEQQGGPAMLFVKRRSSENDPWSGQVALPGGRWEHGDRDLIDTARRELGEEVGLSLGEEVVLLGAMRDISPANMPTLTVRPFVGFLERWREVRPGPELAAAFWTPIASLRRRVCRVCTRRKRVFDAQAFVFDNEVIWGMTARILRELFEILEPLP